MVKILHLKHSQDEAGWTWEPAGSSAPDNLSIRVMLLFFLLVIHPGHLIVQLAQVYGCVGEAGFQIGDFLFQFTQGLFDSIQLCSLAMRARVAIGIE